MTKNEFLEKIQQILEDDIEWHLEDAKYSEDLYEIKEQAQFIRDFADEIVTLIDDWYEEHDDEDE